MIINDDYKWWLYNLKGTPIISGPESPTQCFNYIIETLLKPIILHLITYIKDNRQFIKF